MGEKADVRERRDPFPAACQKQHGEHGDRPLGEDLSLPLVRLKQKVGCRGQELVLGLFAVQGVEPIPEALGIDDAHGPKLRPVAGGLLEEVAFDVVHDNGMGPG